MKREQFSSNPLKWTLVEWLQVIGWAVFLNLFWVVVTLMYILGWI